MTKNERALEATAELASAVQFLSRLPVYRLLALPQHVKDALTTNPDFSKVAAHFPIAGVIIAVPAAMALLVFTALGTPALVAATITIVVLLISTGALHEDGLADSADGFWGGHSKERKLSIMRDSMIGSYGTLALIMSIAMRITCLSVVIERLPNTWAAAIVLAIAGLSRAAMLYPWVELPAARAAIASPGVSEKTKDESGLSARFGVPDSTTLRHAAMWSLLPIMLLVSTINPVPTVLVLLVTAACVWSITRLMQHHIEGHTGDTLGATQQSTEIGCLIALIVFM